MPNSQMKLMLVIIPASGIAEIEETLKKVNAIFTVLESRSGKLAKPNATLLIEVPAENQAAVIKLIKDTVAKIKEAEPMPLSQNIEPGEFVASDKITNSESDSCSILLLGIEEYLRF